tara:strand:+ start:54 stop:371 length:318 start_codon:yes stop_codon:yes gene_type:complete
MPSKRTLQGKPGGFPTAIGTYGKKGLGKKINPRPSSDRKEYIDLRDKFNKERQLKELTRKKKEFIEDRKERKTLKKPKEQRFQDGGLAVRGTGAQVKKTTFKGVF